MFRTELEDFDYKPYVKDGELIRGKVVCDCYLVWYEPGQGLTTVKKGFVTDLASLPWFTSFLFKKLGKHQRAAVLHDWMYRTKPRSKSWADKQFNLAMEQDGVARWRRNLIISGLKLGGWYAWRNPKPVEIVE